MSKKRVMRDWPAVLAEFRKSGCSVQDFCQDRGINPGLFYKWRRRLSKSKPAEPGNTNTGFVELIGRSPDTCPSGVRIQVGPEMTICLDRKFDPGTLRDVLQTITNGVPQ